MMCLLSLRYEAKKYSTKPMSYNGVRREQLNQDTLSTMSVRSWAVALYFCSPM